MIDLPVTLRVRPVRIAILISRSVEPSDLVRIVRFLSQLWGGRYSLILPVDADTPDSLTEFRLAFWRPDCVYGVDIAQEPWEPVVNKACQPRQFCPLDPEVAENIRKAVQSGFIHGDHAVFAMFKARHERSRFNRPLAVVPAERSAPLAPFCAAMFGVHPQELRDDYRDETREVGTDDAADFVNLCIDFCKNDWQTWLDANAFGLSSYLIQTPTPEPTVVLVDDTVADLSLFWNLRTVSETDETQQFLPVPYSQTDNQPVIEAIANWLRRFDSVTNYCTVTSSSVSEPDCASFAAKLKDALSDTSIEYVDCDTPRNRVPRVVAYESQVTWSVKQDGQKIEFLPPKPTALPTLSGSDCWYIDLVNDATSRRAIAEMQPPSSVVIPEILNGPCPPHFEHAAVNRFGEGVDSLNVRCSSNKELIQFYVPSAEEVLEELLREGGYEPVHDEKRSSYLPTIERFGGLHPAASALSGKSGEIIQTFSAGTMLPRQIRSKCRLGGGALQIDDYLGRVDDVNRRRSERTRRIVRGRFEEHARGDIPERLTLGSYLEHWADRSVLARSWRLGPCSRCEQEWFAEEVSIQQSIQCPNCGNRVFLSEHVAIGYSLSPPVSHSLKEGIVPVVLTGRFLRNMTSRGFLWLPGLKYTKGGNGGDADIVACCDGHLVFAECKRLVDVAPNAEVWSEVVDQFLELANVAVDCGGDLVVLASQADSFPEDVVRRIEDSLKERIPFVLLNAADLESGHRKTGDGRWVSIPDLLPAKFPEVRRKREGARREINLGFGRFTKGQ